MGERVIYVDGEFHSESQARISPFDRGFLYGDGVYDTCTAVNGYIFKLDRHVERFYDSARAIKIEIPLSKENFRDVILETVRRNALRDAYIKMIATRGVGKPFVSLKSVQKGPTLVIFAYPPKNPSETYAKGGRAIISSIRKIPPSSGVEPRIKNLNYLNNVMMAIEAMDAGADEAIALDLNGYVQECIAANIFALKNGSICTPPPYNVLGGVTREAVMEVAEELGYKVRELFMTPYDLYVADEVFVSSTASAGESYP